MELILIAVALLIGIAIGLTVRRRGTDVERVRVQYVDKPTVVEKIIEKVRVEYVDKPYVVEKPTIQIKEVPVHTETIREVEKAAPSLVDRVRGLVAPDAATHAAAPASGDVRLVLMDQHERNVKHTETVGANFRRPTLIRNGMKFAAARQAANGDWIYRQLPRERA